MDCFRLRSLSYGGQVVAPLPCTNASRLLQAMTSVNANAYSQSNGWPGEPSIPVVRRLNEPAIMRRADQNLVHADARGHAGDEGDGTAAILGLQHLGLLVFRRHHRAQ